LRHKILSRLCPVATRTLPLPRSGPHFSFLGRGLIPLSSKTSTSPPTVPPRSYWCAFLLSLTHSFRVPQDFLGSEFPEDIFPRRRFSQCSLCLRSYVRAAAFLASDGQSLTSLPQWKFSPPAKSTTQPPAAFISFPHGRMRRPSNLPSLAVYCALISLLIPPDFFCFRLPSPIPGAHVVSDTTE